MDTLYSSNFKYHGGVDRQYSVFMSANTPYDTEWYRISRANITIRVVDDLHTALRSLLPQPRAQPSARQARKANLQQFPDNKIFRTRTNMLQPTPPGQAGTGSSYDLICKLMYVANSKGGGVIAQSTWFFNFGM